jgi:ankyrin repeat protein
MNNLQEQVYNLCGNEDNPEELRALLRVDVNQFRNAHGWTALHNAAAWGSVGYVHVLLEHGADVEARDENGDTPTTLASGYGQLECLKVLIEARADVQARRIDEAQAIHFASENGHAGCLKLLIHEGADVNAQNNTGITTLMCACDCERLACVQLLLDANADITMLGNMGADTLYWAIRLPQGTTAHRVPGMPFSVLSCNTNTTDIRIDANVTQAMVDTSIEEYKAVHAHIDEYHNVLKHALSEDVQVDTRFGLGENGIYQEPLERVLEYMGLSINKDQVVNASIDVNGKRRALIPGNVLEANHWHEEYTKAVSKAARERELVQHMREMKEKQEEERLAFEATRQARRASGAY